MSRWRVLWRAIVRWWKNELPPALPEPKYELIHQVRYHLQEYNGLYAQRVGTMSQYAQQAANIVAQQGQARAPTLDSEVRVLAIALTLTLQLLAEELERQQKLTEILQERKDANYD